MPAGLFHFKRYFKKNDDSSTGEKDQSNVVKTDDSKKQTTVSTTAQTAPYSGIGKPPVQTSTSQSLPRSNIDMQKRVGMDVLSRLTQRSSQVLMTAASKAKELKVQYIDTEHVLWALLGDSSIYQLVSECKAVPSEIQAALEKSFKMGKFKATPQFSPRMKRVLELSLSTAKSLGYEFISPEHILLALSHEGEGLAARTLVKFNIKTEVLNQKITGRKKSEKEEKEKKTSTLEQFAEDLTVKAARGELDPVIGRSWEIERVIHIISRRTKNNPVLIGDAGVGKTAIVEGLAMRIARADVPETLLHKRILSLDLMSLIAGARHRGEFEERLKNLIKEVKSAGGAIILFIDELHNMVGAGSGGEGTMDASNILKPSLARGELQAIGTTTVTEYRKYIEKDPALERRFQPVLVSEPTVEIAIDMLTALRDRYEAFHRVKISDEAIGAAVRLSKRYVGDRFLPDKAVDLIDEAAAAVRLPSISLPEEIKRDEDRLKRLNAEKQEAEKTGDKVRASNLEKEIEETEHELADLKEKYQTKKSTTTTTVTADIIAEIVSRWTNIPVERLTESESAKLLDLEKIIHKRLIDQEEAVSAIAEAVRRGRAGLKSDKRPIGSFIFMGPTGVGKTELAKTLAEILFGSEELIVRLDMSEYMEKHEVAKLIGAPPGYVGYEEGGQLTEAVRRHPYSVVLLDEIEKAHLDVFNILIQLLDDGRLTDNKGRTISFKNTIVICTSNLGSGIIQEELLMLGKDRGEKASTSSTELSEEEKKKEIFKTYTVSPTEREIITLADKYWQKDHKDSEWKVGKLEDYFAGSVITEDEPASAKATVGEGDFPIDGLDTHLIAPDGSETITCDDKMWFRTSTTAKEWTLNSLLEQIKGHMVINALPDRPEEQLPTAKIDTHAISPANMEMVSFGDRFWKRDNLQIKDWTTGFLSDYFAEAKLRTKNLELKTKNKEFFEEDQEKKTKKPASSLINQQRFAERGKDTPLSGVEGLKKTQEDFPTEKWDIHLFKPTGEEIIIAADRFWQRKDINTNEWTSGEVKDLFTTTVVLDAKEEDLIPLGKTIEEEEEGKLGEAGFARLAERLMGELRKFFRPELLNRYDEVIIFRPLEKKHMMAIVGLQLKGLSKNLREQNIAIEVSEEAKAYLAEVGFDYVFGARPLRRIIQRLVENPMSSMLIKGDLGRGDTITVGLDGNGLTFEVKKFEAKKVEVSTQPVEGQVKSFHCDNCGYEWQVKVDGEKITECPSCKGNAIKEIEVTPSDQEKQVVLEEQSEAQEGLIDQKGQVRKDQSVTPQPIQPAQPSEEGQPLPPENQEEVQASQTSQSGQESPVIKVEEVEEVAPGEEITPIGSQQKPKSPLETYFGEASPDSTSLPPASSSEGTAMQPANA